MHDSSAAVFDDYAMVAAVSEERLTRVKGSGESVPWLAIDEVLRIAGWSRRDVDAIALTRGFHPTYHLRVPLWRELRYSVERARGTGARPARPRDPVAPPRHRRYAAAVSCRAIPARQRVPAGHGDPFRQPSRGARARGAVLHRLERRAGLYLRRHRRQCQLLDALPEERQARMPLRRRPLADPDAEGDRARERLRLRDGRVRLQDAAPRGQADRALGLWRAEACR